MCCSFVFFFPRKIFLLLFQDARGEGEKNARKTRSAGGRIARESPREEPGGEGGRSGGITTRRTRGLIEPTRAINHPGWTLRERDVTLRRLVATVPVIAPLTSDYDEICSLETDICSDISLSFFFLSPREQKTLEGVSDDVCSTQ